MRAICALMIIGLAIPAGALGQARGGAAPGPRVVSPQVNPDRSVTLRVHGIVHTFKITPGRHVWRLWRPHLYEFAQLLFTDKKTGGTRPE